MTVESQTDSPDLAADTELGDRYLLSTVVGRGGFGVVYAAIDKISGEQVAVKVLRSDRVDSSAAQRFGREARTSQRLAHPNLIPVLDWGVDDQVPWIVMPLVEGESLKERLRRGPLTAPETVQMAREILSALQTLHDAGVVHRDVKPGNILFSTSGAAHLSDLGLVTSEDQDDTYATHSGALIGTVAYLSPEQALGRPVSAQSDLYSMGVTLFECLTGRLPYDRASSLGAVIAQVTEAAPPVGSFNGNSPAWLSAVVARLVAKKTEDRYASAREAEEDLAGSRFTPPASTVRRRALRTVAATLAVIAVAGVVWLARLGPRAVARGALAAAEVKSGALRALDDSGAVL